MKGIGKALKIPLKAINNSVMSLNAVTLVLSKIVPFYHRFITVQTITLCVILLQNMIRSFKDKETEFLYVTGRSKKFSLAVCKVGIRKLDYLNAAVRIEDLRIPPGNRLEALKGEYEGKYSIRINDQFRIVFRFVDTDAFDVEIVDYH